MPVLLAGVEGVGKQDHQAMMWAPRLADAGLRASRVWCPPDAGEMQIRKAVSLASSLGVQLSTDDVPPIDGGAVIACLRGVRRRQVLNAASQTSATVLVDKPTLDSTIALQSQVAAAKDARLLSGLHFASHPSFVRASRAVADGEIGLLRAVMIDLVVSSGDGASPAGDLRNIGVHAVDLMHEVARPRTLTVGTAALSAGVVTFTAQTEHDIVLSAHVSRTDTASTRADTLLAHVRIVGSHGHIDLDLLRPALTVTTSSRIQRAKYGTDSVTARLRELRAVASEERAPEVGESWLTVSRTLDAIAESATRADSITIRDADSKEKR
ncbi:Gfo/Idh/MocA family oxidoreductase [Microbacterium saperdae]